MTKIWITEDELYNVVLLSTVPNLHNAVKCSYIDNACICIYIYVCMYSR